MVETVNDLAPVDLTAGCTAFAVPANVGDELLIITVRQIKMDFALSEVFFAEDVVITKPACICSIDSDSLEIHLETCYHGHNLGCHIVPFLC